MFCFWNYVTFGDKQKFKKKTLHQFPYFSKSRETEWLCVTFQKDKIDILEIN